MEKGCIWDQSENAAHHGGGGKVVGITPTVRELRLPFLLVQFGGFRMVPVRGSVCELCSQDALGMTR